ncbi:DUF2442 domain-containing protein [Candidatus Methylobacter oryzae]|uniref:DUF2442 domain-containing protein n=1 Tax=Candidatus Methylobacter oryzae TaxID=2497749 RepID=A0ABY3C947_9GAMM|nr:DUF2442 domain-containing protein [Candidatus Methylobacter oryzae]TRW93113.1 DUF2442 domain-containing protein [Candidatus Methylobacter oryzae]
MKLINVEPKDDYIVRIYLDDDTVVDFDVKAELERIPCYKSLYDNELFKTVKFKNKRIYWNDQCDFHLDQILERGRFVNIDAKEEQAAVSKQAQH